MIQEKFDRMKEMIEEFYDPTFIYSEISKSFTSCVETVHETGSISEEKTIENIALNVQCLITFYNSHPEACLAFMKDIIEYNDIIEVQDLKKAKA